MDSPSFADYMNKFVTSLGYDKFFFVPSSGLFKTDPATRRFYKDLVDFLDRNHRKDFAHQHKQLVMMSFALSDDKVTAMTMIGGTYGFYVLVKGGNIVAIAQFDGATTIATVTVPKKERGQGHAKILLAAIGLAFKTYDLVVFTPSYVSHERGPASVGWTRATDTLAPDGTIDLMPEHAKPLYLAAKKTFYVKENGEQDDEALLKPVRMNWMLSIAKPEQYAVPKK